MAYPKGFRYRFRFDEEWVHDEIKNNISILIGKKGLIVFRDKAEAKFYPIRYFTLSLARRIGIIYYFEYELGEFVDFSSDENWRSTQLTNFNKEFAEFHGSKFISNEPGKDMKPLVLLSGFKPEIVNQHYGTNDPMDREYEQWGNIVTLTRNIKFYEGVEFIKLIGAEPMKLDSGESYFKNGYLYVKAGDDYKLMVLQHVPKGGQEKSEPRDIEVKSDNKYIEILRNKARAVGKYDVLTFIFRVRTKSGGHDSFIDIIHTPKTENQQYIEPKLYIPIRINRQLKKLIIKSALCGIFTFAYFFIHFHPQTSLGFLGTFLKDLSLIGITVIIIELLKEIKVFLRQD